MALRFACLALGILAVTAVPFGSPTPGLGPYDMSADVSGGARVGDELVVLATLRNHWAGEGPFLFQLEVPDWVDVASAREWPLESANGTTHRRAWVLTPTQEGAWSAEITARDPQTSEVRGNAWWGFTAWSSAKEGRWASYAEHGRVLPDGGGTGRLTAREVAPDVYNVTYEATATAPWLRGQNLTMRLGPWVGGFSKPGVSVAVPVDSRQDPFVQATWGTPASMYGEMAIQDGAERARIGGKLEARVLFPGAITSERMERVIVDCRTLTVLPGWQANLPPQGERECAKGTAWHSPGPDSILAVAALALLVAMARRGRPPTGSPSPTCGSA